MKSESQIVNYGFLLMSGWRRSMLRLWGFGFSHSNLFLRICRVFEMRFISIGLVIWFMFLKLLVLIEFETSHKEVGLISWVDNSAVSATGARVAFKSNEEIELQVRSVPLDRVIAENKRLLLMKIDVQDWEYHVLKGADKLCLRKKSEASCLIYEEDERLLQASNSSSKEIRR